MWVSLCLRVCDRESERVREGEGVRERVWERGCEREGVREWEGESESESERVWKRFAENERREKEWEREKGRTGRQRWTPKEAQNVFHQLGFHPSSAKRPNAANGCGQKLWKDFFWNMSSFETIAQFTNRQMLLIVFWVCCFSINYVFNIYSQ